MALHRLILMENLHRLGWPGLVGTVLLLAGLAAGAFSMAAGEYVSVSSQADAERADARIEAHALREYPDAELEELTEIYVRRGVELALAKQVAQHLSAHWGGQLLYIPKNHFGKLDERDKEIWAAFNGHNHAELARRYDLTMQQVYKILKQIGTKVRAKSQADLFAS